MEKRLQGENNLVIRVSNTLTSLVVLNFMTIIACIPVITIGAALTAMQDCLQQMVRKEDGYIARRFIGPFKANFKQATLLWLPFLFIFAGVVFDIVISFTSPGVFPDYIMIPAFAGGIIALFIWQWVCPVQARFEGNFKMVIRMSFLLSAARFPRTFLMAVTILIPYFCSRSLFTLPLLFMFGFSLPGYICARLYAKVFAELEEEEEDNNIYIQNKGGV
ncbi:MAG: YesL family protein [Eubacterium sp.]|nr:YesL family protein [Eubacterium sp.]